MVSTVLLTFTGPPGGGTLPGRALSPRAQAKETRTCSPRKAGTSPLVYTFAQLSPVPPAVEPYLQNQLP